MNIKNCLVLSLSSIWAVPYPYIRLIDNLDEPKDLGFCLDITGIPGSTLQFHEMQTVSCEPGNGGTDE